MTHAHDPADDDLHIVEVYSAANEIDAGAIRAALDEAGIEARLVGDLAGNAFDIPLGVSAPKIWVREADAPAARRIIEDLQSRIVHDEPLTEQSGDE
jgi:hypothetical protein